MNVYRLLASCFFTNGSDRLDFFGGNLLFVVLGSVSTTFASRPARSLSSRSSEALSATTSPSGNLSTFTVCLFFDLLL